VTNSQNQLIVKAVGELGRRVTVADVVAKTGQSVGDVSQALNKLASETNANLEVTKTGEIYYCYQPNYFYLLLARNFAVFLRHGWNRIMALLFFAFKMSFGILLLVSIMCVMTTILIIQTIALSFSGNSTLIANMWMDFWTICVRFTQRQMAPSEIDPNAADGAKTNFLLDCYSFLFGDGNPNGNVEETRWQLIAQTIRLNEGVVLAEHLAPYLARDPDEERDIFSVLAKFGGIPEVSESGNIVYVFPTMRSRSAVSSYGLVPALLEQKLWKFSYLNRDRMRKMLALIVANLLGSGLLVLIFAITHRQLHHLFLFFWIYSSMYLVIPSVRFVILKLLNRNIKASNKRAQAYEQRLGNPSQELLVKLDEAEHMRSEAPPAVAEEVIYTTARDLLDQSIEQAQGG
jgi:hypothetical protein